MPNYRLKIDFEAKDLHNIYNAEQKITIVKKTGEKSHQLSWCTFSPFLCNTIDWQSEYALYASNTEIDSGIIINKLSDSYASDNFLYRFKNAIFKETTFGQGINGTYYLKNEMNDFPTLTFGLAQNIMINGKAFNKLPLNAIYVEYNQVSSIVPFDKVSVFLSNDIQTSSVLKPLNEIKHGIIELDFTEKFETRLRYNGKTGQFIYLG